MISQGEELRLLKAREYVVAKSNEVVRKSRYELSTQEQKAIAYICSLIKPRSVKEIAMGVPPILEYEFNIRDYCRICGIDYDNGNNYIKIKASLKGLRDKSYWLMLEDGTETTISWINKVNCNKRSGIVKIRLDEDMIPYLFDLKEKFISYGLFSILAMKCQYSIRIYELLKSYTFQKSKTFEIDQLKKLLMVENIKSYSNFKDFRNRVLDKALKEINLYTDIEVAYETELKGRKVVKVKFIMRKKDADDIGFSYAKIEKQLGSVK